ncbi:MAG: flotillin-like FloA family protein [Lentisphaeria bacterium]|nr:flotillin-like FloA family protein [Lentisphaeria bacterium]
MAALLVILGAVGAAIFLAAAVVVALFFKLWLTAKAAGVPFPILRMAVMRLRRVSPARVLDGIIRLWKSGETTPLDDLEAHILSGGQLEPVVEALIAARKAGLDTDFRTMAAINLAGRDVVDAVRARVNPKVLVIPPPGSGLAGITGVAQDGIQLAAKARVTVRTQLDRLVGGAGEDTVTARVGEGIVAAIGRARSHRDILAKPEQISAYLLDKGLDSGTCFEILSVDIADVDVLDNIAARLNSSRAEADKRIAQARAEVRRAAAVASQHEMRARTVESHSRVAAARAHVPLAVASSFTEANMGAARPLHGVLNHRLRWRWRA